MKVTQAQIYTGETIPPSAQKKPLFITSCGHISNMNQPNGSIRPEGRSDYQLIFINNGYLYAKNCDGIETKIPPKSIVVFKPFQPQIYYSRPDENAGYYWIHFGGTQAEQLLKQVGLNDKFYYTDINFNDCMSPIHSIISEIRLKRTNYEMQCCLHFCNMLNNIYRENSETTTVDNAINRLTPALNAIENDMHIHRSIDDYAKLCSLSPYHFMHLFKQCTGFTVLQYKNHICMESAMHLLKNSSMNINEIAASIGMDDSSYFSKKFKNYYGFSPTKFRK